MAKTKVNEQSRSLYDALRDNGLTKDRAAKVANRFDVVPHTDGRFTSQSAKHLMRAAKVDAKARWNQHGAASSKKKQRKPSRPSGHV